MAKFPVLTTERTGLVNRVSRRCHRNRLREVERVPSLTESVRDWCCRCCCCCCCRQRQLFDGRLKARTGVDGSNRCGRKSVQNCHRCRLTDVVVGRLSCGCPWTHSPGGQPPSESCSTTLSTSASLPNGVDCSGNRITHIWRSRNTSLSLSQSCRHGGTLTTRSPVECCTAQRG